MSNRLTVIRSAATATMGEATPVANPLGGIVALNRLAQFQTVENSDAQIGIWQCEPGQLRRQPQPHREFIHVLSGWCVFTPQGGEPVELHAGDSAIFPANCQGVWDIKQTLRKVFCLF